MVNQIFCLRLQSYPQEGRRGSVGDMGVPHIVLWYFKEGKPESQVVFDGN